MKSNDTFRHALSFIRGKEEDIALTCRKSREKKEPIFIFHALGSKVWQENAGYLLLYISKKKTCGKKSTWTAILIIAEATVKGSTEMVFLFWLHSATVHCLYYPTLAYPTSKMLALPEALWAGWNDFIDSISDTPASLYIKATKKWLHPVRGRITLVQMSREVNIRLLSKTKFKASKQDCSRGEAMMRDRATAGRAVRL